MTRIEMLREAAAYLKNICPDRPDWVLVLGSGLGELADNIDNCQIINYTDIPHFPLSSAPGHKGRLVCGNLNHQNVIAFQGRFHYYEGHSFSDIAFPIQVMKLLDAQKMLLTNAAGGIKEDFHAGDLMLITDHIKLCQGSPLRGENCEELGPRFPDMTQAYSKELRKAAKIAAAETGIPLKEGCYAFMSGPSFETPAEIKMLRSLGADAVGMSTVPEVITAAHCGLPVLAISCISNLASGILDKPLSSEEVFETTERIRMDFISLLARIIKEDEI